VKNPLSLLLSWPAIQKLKKIDEKYYALSKKGRFILINVLKSMKNYSLFS